MKKRMTVSLLVAAVAATFALGGCSGGKEVERLTSYVYVSDEPVYSSTVEVISAVADSVVEIRTEYVSTQWGMQYVISGAGSGVIVSHGEGTDNYYIVTNNHVIENANQIEVTLRDGSIFPARLIATDARSDIAVVTVSSARNLTLAVWGDSDKLMPGEDVIAIGNPLGSLGGTVTKGIISATARNIVVNNYTMTLLQTDTAINPGNSGGGLFDMKGRLVGIVNAKKSDEEIEGICFAIPANTAKSVADDLLKYGAVQGRVSFGISVAESKGTVYVTDASGAASDTFRMYDKITDINGTAISSALSYNNVLAGLKPGDSVRVTVYRGMAIQTILGPSISFESDPTVLNFIARQA